METEPLKAFKEYALSKGFEVELTDHVLVFKNVLNPGNNFKILKQYDHYNVYTVAVSKADYEYTAKCSIYLLLAEFNTYHSQARHLHLNYKVDL